MGNILFSPTAVRLADPFTLLSRLNFGVVITDAIKFVQTNKEKLTMSTKRDQNGKESEEPDYGEDELEEKWETGELNQGTTNNVF